MSDKTPKEGKAKKGGNKLVLIGGAVALLAVGGGGGFAAMKMMGGGEAKAKEDNSPKLIRKGEEDPYAAKKEGEGEGAGLAEVEGDGGDEYRTAYYTFADEFTSNLKDTGALVQMSIACSTRRDGRVLLWLKKHELAIRSRFLTILADTPENDVSTVEGKERLQKRMTAAINQVLTEKEGFGGVDAVYFRTFIVQ
ncbi:flagellar basal body-associated FliL family protein [Novosphingobium colocasiae]|uniref:Flagellar protein FliL n=1 Tax=Novosphingobium colocasiae TaxID=1256513 RepID=A0A918PEY1_9SPHN|nr:flagellar basal body-associated FliL family protein [Novosphingobium colocasiae]GGZ03801.1 hypothetical protein GCM10011614_18500 [Novosphingobium colocasiae]